MHHTDPFRRIQRGSIRPRALDKLAILSLKPSQTGSQLNGTANGSLVNNINGSTHPAGLSGDILKLANAVAHTDISSIPITHKELEIIFSLTKACKHVQTLYQANDLLAVLAPYFLESPFQKFKSNSSLQLSPSPWDYLTKELTDAIIYISERFPNTKDKVEVLFDQYISKFQVQDGLKLTSYFSLLGFLKSLVGSNIKFETALIEKIFKLFNNEFLDSFETIVSTSLEEELDYTYLLAYQTTGDEFNALLFTKYIQLLSNNVLSFIIKAGTQDDPITHLLKLYAADYDAEPASASRIDEIKNSLTFNLDLLKLLAQNAVKQVNELDNGSTYINLSSNGRVNLAFETKSLSLQVIGTSLIVDLVSEDYATDIVKTALSHESEIVDFRLAPSVISLGSLLIYKNIKNIGGDLIHTFPLIISSTTSTTDPLFVKKISQNLALGLKPLDQDSIITTIYSLVNLLAVDANGEPIQALRDLKLKSVRNTFSSHLKPRVSRANTINSLVLQHQSVSSVNLTNEHTKSIFKNAITSAVEMAKAYGDQTITVLTTTVLSQKFQKVSRDLDNYLLAGFSSIAAISSEKEFVLLLRLFANTISRASDANDEGLVKSIVDARMRISRELNGKFDHPLYRVYLDELLRTAVSRGDVQNVDHHRSHGEISKVAEKISYLLRPLAELLPSSEPLSLSEDDVETINLFRSFWFNLVVHGYNETSGLTLKHKKDLETIALNSPPLAADFPRQHAETSFELNTVLRRGSSNHNVKDQKHIISGLSNANPLELRTLSYPKLMFLSATSLLENLRTNAGECSTVLHYFSDHSIAKANIEKLVGAIAISVVNKFIKLTAKGGDERFTSDKVASQLTKVFILCCHRNFLLQDAAFQSANLFLNKLPSSLCHTHSLYTLLDILTLLFDSIVDSGRNKYQPQRVFSLEHSNVSLTLSDSSKWRITTLERFQTKAKEWCTLALLKTNQDMKSLLQSYISDLGLLQRMNGVELGISFAIEIAGTILPAEFELSNVHERSIKNQNSIARFLSQYGWRASNLAGQKDVVASKTLLDAKELKQNNVREQLARGETVSDDDLIGLLDSIATILILRKNEENSAGLVHELVSLPFELLKDNSVNAATNIWLSIIKERQDDLSYLLLSEIAVGWQNSIKRQIGLFNKTFDLTDEGFLKMTYSPSDELKVNYASELASKNLSIHSHIIQFFSSHFQGTLFESDHLLKIFTGVVVDSLDQLKKASLHPFARLIRNELIRFALDVTHTHLRIKSKFTSVLINSILDGALSWFTVRGHYPFGGNNLKIKSDFALLINIFEEIRLLEVPNALIKKKTLLLVFLKDEISKIMIWLSPLAPHEFKGEAPKASQELVPLAFDISPGLAFGLVTRFGHLHKYLKDLITTNPSYALDYKESVDYLLETPSLHKYLIFAKPISPTKSINLFQPPYFNDPFIIQYNMRSLESHDVNLTFFYVPQIVQSLRSDSLGYVGRFIVETGKVDQLFAHQIIWNFLANRYKDEDATIEDSIKPRLDVVMQEMIDSFSGEDKLFYETEFKFFDEVTSISGKLKPYIKKTKAEKKLKIDEEMKRIEVVDNVYLPSNPDGVVVDINRNSGKPLQSHAKAPFMATFKIRKFEEIQGETIKIEKWQSAIFKVGDDCRQDVLALQLISIFKSIWENSGLDLYCFPYRVTATAPGCGVIDVLPNSISRDMLGREAVNGLYEYFVSKFGNEDSIEFENARNNFVKSLAAYSIISYLLQFKDRHNGNIMYDDKGHILHIDFGFCFDIAPGGVTFEAVPFKLSKEMVKVMGGSNETESFKMFEELFIKGFLSVRPFYHLIVGNVTPMLGSGLPCFKEKTIKNLTNRFFLEKDDKQVIGSLRGLIKKSYESLFTVGYDKFQKMTNGIPY